MLRLQSTTFPIRSHCCCCSSKILGSIFAFQNVRFCSASTSSDADVDAQQKTKYRSPYGNIKKAQPEEYLHGDEPIPIKKGATPSHFDFAARYEQLRNDDESSLSSEPYQELMKNLQQYDDLLRKYSVKQSDVERARRAAKMCGLAMTEQKLRK